MKILVEKSVAAREIEVSVLGNSDPKASVPGEIVPHREFYDYTAKYLEDGTQLLIPAKLKPAQIKQIQSLAVAAFRARGRPITSDRVGSASTFAEPGLIWGRVVVGLWREVPSRAKEAGRDQGSRGCGRCIAGAGAPGDLQ